MAITLNGQALFDEQQFELEVESVSRDSIERSVPGLDGLIAIDLGERGRLIKQKGTLRAKSILALEEKLAAIRDYVDGYTYTLVTNDGRVFDNLRIDVFKTKNRRPSGVGMAIDYEIIYTQLISG
jgi:hypothetical protein